MAPRDPPARPPRSRVWFSMRRAAREGRRTTSPAGGAGNRRSVGHPASEEAREGGIVARPLFENSTACRKSVPSNTPCLCHFVVGAGIPLVDGRECQLAVL